MYPVEGSGITDETFKVIDVRGHYVMSPTLIKCRSESRDLMPTMFILIKITIAPA